MGVPGDVSTWLTIENPVFTAYAFYTAMLALKMMSVSFLTARQRIRKKVFSSPEDAVLKTSKVKYDDPDVERVRRAHLNDLENIPVFMIIAFLYTLTGPSPFVAINLFRAFTAARFVHTFVYAIYVVPQPARGIAYGVGALCTFYMTVQVLKFFLGL